MNEEHRFVTLFCGVCGWQKVVQLSCGKRTCSLCRQKWFGQHYNKLRTIVSGWARPRCLTLTYKNILDGRFSRRSVEQIRNHFSELRKRLKPWIRGGFYIPQATNSGNGWHLHLHVIYDGDYLQQKFVSELWRKITKGSYVVGLSTPRSPARAIRYLLSDFSGKPRIRPEDFDVYNAVFHGSRMVQGFGTCKDVSLEGVKRCPKCGAEGSISRLETIPGFDYETYIQKHPQGLSP